MTNCDTISLLFLSRTEAQVVTYYKENHNVGSKGRHAIAKSLYVHAQLQTNDLILLQVDYKPTKPKLTSHTNINRESRS